MAVGLCIQGAGLRGGRYSPVRTLVCLLTAGHVVGAPAAASDLPEPLGEPWSGFVDYELEDFHPAGDWASIGGGISVRTESGQTSVERTITSGDAIWEWEDPWFVEMEARHFVTWSAHRTEWRRNDFTGNVCSTTTEWDFSGEVPVQKTWGIDSGYEGAGIGVHADIHTAQPGPPGEGLYELWVHARPHDIVIDGVITHDTCGQTTPRQQELPTEGFWKELSPITDVERLAGSLTFDWVELDPHEWPEGTVIVESFRWELQRDSCADGHDSDGDGFSDCDELAAGTDPLNSTSHPGAPGDGGNGDDGNGDGGNGNGGNGNDGENGNGEEGEENGATYVRLDRGRGHIGIVCGTAAFDWYHNTRRPMDIARGDEVCTFLLSNVVANELLDAALGLDHQGLSEAFGALLLGTIREEAQLLLADAIWSQFVQAELKLGSNALILALFPGSRPILFRANIVAQGTSILALGAFPLHAGLWLSQIREHGACVQFDLTLRDGTLSIDRNLIRNPLHTSASPSEIGFAHVFERHERGRLRRDHFQRHSLGLHCAPDGMVSVPGASTTALQGSFTTVLMVPEGHTP